MNATLRKYYRYFARCGIASLIIMASLGSLYAMSASPSKGGPVLYITNNTNSKIWARDIPTQDYGKDVPVIYYTPTEFDPLHANMPGKHDFYFNQWFGHPGQASGKITLVSDSNDPNRWDNPLKIEIKEKGITEGVFKPNDVRDFANKREKTLEIRYTVTWNGNGWKIILDEVGKQ